jgi:hypothetical protein
MKTILMLAERVRNEVNDRGFEDTRFGNRLDHWFALCVAMDYLEDTCLALLNYEERGLGNKEEEKYLRLYGFFQAVFLQQDVIRYLYKEFVGRELKYSRPSGWNQIRELRNLTAGHPINCEGLKNAFVHRVSISDRGFNYEVWNNKTGKFTFEEVNLLKLYGHYRINARRLLADVLREIRSISAKRTP